MDARMEREREGERHENFHIRRKVVPRQFMGLFKVHSESLGMLRRVTNFYRGLSSFSLDILQVEHYPAHVYAYRNSA